MDLEYSPEYQAFREEVRSFLAANKHRAPGARAAVPGQPNAAKAWQKLLLEHGYAGRTIPREYGGYGAEPDVLKSRILAEEFARARVPPGHSGDNRIVPTVLELGTEEQKRWLVPPSVRGDMVWCQGYSEPGSGSDITFSNP